MENLTHVKHNQPAHRDFWEAGHRIFGLYPFKGGRCGCGNKDCKAVGKHPLISNWQHTPHWDAEQIEAMEMADQFATGFGVLIRGLLVIDVDARNGGVDSYERLRADFPEIEKAGLIVATGSGGGSKHVYFTIGSELALVQKHADYPGIDFKSSGYVVGPGSKHVSGASYAVEYGSPDDIDAAPVGLVDLLRKPDRHRTEVQGTFFDVSHADLADMLAHVDPDADHETWIRCGMAVHHASAGTAFDVWDRWSVKGTKYPGADVLAKRWHSFGKASNPVTLGTLMYYAEACGWKQSVTFEVTENREGNPTSNIQRSSLAPANELWSEPLPLPDGLRTVEKLAASMLPKSIAPWIFDIADRMQCPADFVAVGALTALGSVIGSRVGIRPQKNTEWVEVPNLWGLVIGRPGAMKSPALAEALRPLKKLQSRANNKYKSAIEKYEVALNTHTTKQKKLNKKLDKQIEDGHPTEGIEKEILALKAPPRPRNKRYEVNDCTYEALGEIMVHNPQGTLMHRDEIIALLSDLSREEKSNARGFFLQAWGGTSSYVFDRIGRGKVEIESACLSVLGSTQPAKAAPFFYDANNEGVGDDGLIQRFSLMVWPDQDKAWINADRPAISIAVNNAHRVFNDLDQIGLKDITNGTYSMLDDERIDLRFDEDALAGFVEWRTLLESDLRSGQYPPALESHFSKYRKLVPSLALIFYLADGGRNAVNRDALERAIRFSNYLKSHALRAYSSGSVARKEAANRILAKIKKKVLTDGFTARSIYCKDWSGLTDAKLVGAALELLMEHGYLREAPPPKGKSVGRPTVSYNIHPCFK